MAKKNKDDIDDNDDFNEDNSENINDADDNFGLPDIEYSPVNREEEKKEEPVHRSKRDVIYSSEGTNPSSGHPSYVPRRKESNAPKIIILLAVLLLVAAGIWYFGIYKPEQDRIQAQQEQELREEEARMERERQAQAERERQEREEADREAARLAAEAEAQSKTGSFETIPDRTGRYYTIVASAIDADLATDYAKKLAQDGQDVKILAPKGRNPFHRVAIRDYENLAGAQAELNDLRDRYGNEVWVVKY
jgi:hypothetical protein